MDELPTHEFTATYTRLRLSFQISRLAPRFRSREHTRDFDSMTVPSEQHRFDLPISEAGPSEPPNHSGLLAQRDFVLYQFVRICSVAAVQILSIAVAIQVYDITHRPLSLGLVGLAQFLPVLLITLPAGDIADRYDRRAILVFVHVAVAAVGVALLMNSFSDVPSMPFVYGTLIFFGAARAFSAPAGQAMAPSLVPKALFPKAVAWGSIIFQCGNIVGPALGGLLYAAGGAHTAYITAIALAMVAGAVLLTMNKHEVVQSGVREARTQRLLGGVRYLWTSPIVLGAISLDLAAVLLGGAVALLPVYADDVLHVGKAGLGYLKASQAFGALLVGLWLARKPIERSVGPWMFGAVALFGVSTICFGLSTHFGLSLLCLAIAGGADMVSVVLRHTLLQINTPEAMRGRVAAVNSVFVGTSNELGELESGLLAEYIGPMKTVVFGGIGTILVTLLWSKMFPALRHADGHARSTGE